MSGYQGSCPSCGAQVVFQLGNTLLKVCDHCGVAVARKGADLENYGKVAALIPTRSVLALGLDGGYEGAPRFTLVGRLQLDYGSGGWDEWLMAFSDGTWAWLSESQGRFHYMAPAALPPLPAFDRVKVGQAYDLGPAGSFVATEVRKARFAAAQGELPFDVVPGSELHFVDLSGPGGQFATADYGAGSAAEAVYVGREVTLPDLGFKAADLPDDEQRRQAVRGESLKCPQCAGPLEVRAPDQTQRIACPYCGSLLDATQDFAVLNARKKPKLKPALPLGSKGRLHGVEWTLIGALERSVTVEGVRYPWEEYLLYEPRHGFRWLVLSKGHWSFVEPINAGDVMGSSYDGETYAHFQSGRARVNALLGEFYWAVKVGDETDTYDYIGPPHMLSREEDGSEVTWSKGTYITRDEVAEAFGIKDGLPEPYGVAPHQPSPVAHVGRVWAAALALAAAVIGVYLFLWIAGGKRVHQQTVTIEPGAGSGTPEAAVFAGPIAVTEPGNLQIKVHAPVSNSWLYVDGALINDETGEVDEFDTEVAYYAGYDSDGSWTEGSQDATAYVPAVSPGRYTLRLEPQWEAGKPVGSYDVTVRSRVPRFYLAFLALLALMAWPMLLAWRHFRFEMERWAESDHPWMESSGGSGGSDDDDDD
jgi:DNA-directed RNA polymerase subunit RPC12/RpoP